MKLYTFSKTSWHVKLFKWIFNEDPTNTYKTMCPYFWTYVCIFVFFPIVLLVKLVGASGDSLLNHVKNTKKRREKKRTLRLHRYASVSNLTPLQAYNLTKTQLYKKHNYSLEYSVDRNIILLCRQHKQVLKDIKNHKREVKEVRVEKFKAKQKKVYDNKVIVVIGYIITTTLSLVVICSLGYALYRLYFIAPWRIIGIGSGIGASVILAIVILFLFVKHLCIPAGDYLLDKLSNIDIKMPRLLHSLRFLRYVAYPFIYIVKGIGHLFGIIGNMIYSTYKKQCPIITWED